MLRKPDVCRLLLEHGLRPQVTSGRSSQLFLCFEGITVRHSTSNSIDTLRLLLADAQIDEDFIFTFEFGRGSHYPDLDALEWLWFNATLAFHGPTLVAFREKIAQAVMYSYGALDYEWDEEVNMMLVRLMDAEMIELYRAGSFMLLPAAFRGTLQSVDSSHRGNAFLRLLVKLKVDVKACIQQEIANLPDGKLDVWRQHPKVPHNYEYRVAFKELEGGHLVLGLERVYDISLPGYHVVSQFEALAADSEPYTHWPFIDQDTYWVFENKSHQHNIRFNRRLATNARKERARTGQKQPRSRMPGAWI